MNNQIAFCPECRQDVQYIVKENKESTELRGRIYDFSARNAYCEKCGGEIYVAELEDENLEALYDEFRRKNDIISLQDIRAIPEKYNIGKRPLSLLLGWGEQTFSRYYDGDMPSKQYSEILKQIYNDPKYYLSLLEKGKDKLQSPLAYKKSKAAVDKLLNSIDTHQLSKINIVAEYLWTHCRYITQLMLQKALYYSQGFFYAFFRDYLFEEDCEAWVLGPVYRAIYERYRQRSYDDCNIETISNTEDFDLSLLTVEEKLLLDCIIRYVCCYSPGTLVTFTHRETPWVSARAGLPADAPSSKLIPKEVIGEYFGLVKDKYHMLTPANIKDYMQDMFSQI